MAKYTVQYRHLKTEDLQDDLVLKNSIIEFLRTDNGEGLIGESARRRIDDLDQDGSVVILNKITDPGQWDGAIFGGQLLQLQHDANVPAIMQSLEEDADEFLLEQVNLGEDGRAIKGVLYFVIVGNHVGLMEDQGVKGRTLERYLTSTLQSIDVVEAGQAVILNGEFLAEDGKQLDSATEITVSAEPSAHVPPDEIDQLIGREVDRQRREGATVFDVLRTLGWTEDSIQRLDEEVPADGWLEGFFSVMIKRKRRKQPISRATINEALRNIDPSDIGMDGEGKEKGGIVKLSIKKRVNMIGALKDPEDAILKIAEALREWSEAGKIDCDFGQG